MAVVHIDWRLKGYRTDFSNRATVFWPRAEKGLCAIEAENEAGEKGARGQALLYSGLLDMGETSAFSAVLESIAMRRAAEYFVLLSASG